MGWVALAHETGKRHRDDRQALAVESWSLPPRFGDMTAGFKTVPPELRRFIEVTGPLQ
jgi:hypothetical protein